MATAVLTVTHKVLRCRKLQSANNFISPTVSCLKSTRERDSAVQATQLRLGYEDATIGFTASQQATRLSLHKELFHVYCSLPLANLARLRASQSKPWLTSKSIPKGTVNYCASKFLTLRLVWIPTPKCQDVLL